MFETSAKLEMISWKSYKLIKKKAMETELSLSGLFVSLSIAFFVVAATAGFLNLAYHSFEKNNLSTQQFEKAGQVSEPGRLSRLFINEAQAADLDLKAQVSQSTQYINLTQGQTSTQIIKFKNIGKSSWQVADVTLEMGPSIRSFSKLSSESWLKFYQLVRLPKEVKPGQTIDISFPLKAPTNLEGMIQENFQLVASERPIPGSLVRILATIKAATVIAPVAVVRTPQAIIPAPSSTSSLCIASINPNPASYQNCNTASNESDATGINFTPLLSAEPLIRVGLFAVPGIERISFDTIFDVYAGSGILLSALPATAIVTVSFDPASRRYSVTLADTVRVTDTALRFIPRVASGIATLLDSASTDNRFRGTIEFRYTEPAKKLWVINELPVETYLKGLAETSASSPLEFQKVMATAARSYALYHYLRGVQYSLTDSSTKHASDHFHVDAYYDQVYRGYNSEARMPGLSAAVDATRGITVAYNGKPVVTPYFSNSDGRTRDWTSVWGGNAVPWLVSVPVTEDIGKTLFGHGVGLSARGALVMTTEGQSWQTILKYFYTGTTLLKIY